MGDISTRAQAVLEETSIIACEDTRRTGKLLGLLGIESKHKRLRSFNAINENEEASKIIAMLLEGNDVALVSDAGTPVVSDPGLGLLRMAYKAAIAVVPIPGSSALIAALSACPIPTNDFQFLGFLERKGEAKTRQVQQIVQSSSTVVFFESPRRLLHTLQELIASGAGERKVFVARELTKVHEELIFASVNKVHADFSERETLLGEFVLVLAPSDSNASYDVDELVAAVAEEGISPTTGSRLIAKLSDLPRREAYQQLLARRDTAT